MSKNINNDKFIKLFTEYKHKITSDLIKESIGENLIDMDKVAKNPATALELATIYKHQFSLTNTKELKDFAKENYVELSDSKFKAFFDKTFNRNLEINVDIDDLKSKVLNNYDELTNLSARFLSDLGYSEGVQNYYKKNCENLKELGSTLLCDYMKKMECGFKPEIAMNKHIYHILSELGDDYGNISRRFTDIDKLKIEDGMVILPCNAIIWQGGTSVDIRESSVEISSAYGAGYEITALLRDKDYVKALSDKFENYINEHSQYIVERFEEQEFGIKPREKQKLPRIN